MPAYDIAEIEKKWQDRWESERVFYVDEAGDRPKFTNVCMYPYPSGDLHMGHVRNYTYGDLLTRYKTMRGFNVMSPDGLGQLRAPRRERRHQDRGPSAGIHRTSDRTDARSDQETRIRLRLGSGGRRSPSRVLPLGSVAVPAALRARPGLQEECRRQLVSRRITRSSPTSRWSTACVSAATPLSRSGISISGSSASPTYADRLLDDLEGLDWPDRVITMQRNWIGRSEGCQFVLQVADTDLTFEVFTTRPDTVFGMTFAVLAPEHPLTEQLIAGSENEAEARAYIAAARLDSEIERLAEGDKTGVFTGAYAINPVNGARVPIYIADYVLMGYGTGRHHGGARPGSARLGLRHQVRHRHHSHRAAARGLGGGGVHRRRPRHQLGLPRRHGDDGRQSQDHRVVRGAGDRIGPDSVPAARLADLPPALLGLSRSRWSPAQRAGWCRFRTPTCR